MDTDSYIEEVVADWLAQKGITALKYEKNIKLSEYVIFSLLDSGEHTTREWEEGDLVRSELVLNCYAEGSLAARRLSEKVRAALKELRASTPLIRRLELGRLKEIGTFNQIEYGYTFEINVVHAFN